MLKGLRIWYYVFSVLSILFMVNALIAIIFLIIIPSYSELWFTLLTSLLLSLITDVQAERVKRELEVVA